MLNYASAITALLNRVLFFEKMNDDTRQDFSFKLPGDKWRRVYLTLPHFPQVFFYLINVKNAIKPKKLISRQSSHNELFSYPEN